MPLAQMPLFPAPDQPDLAEWEHSLCFTGHRPEKLPEGEALEALLGNTEAEAVTEETSEAEAEASSEYSDSNTCEVTDEAIDEAVEMMEAFLEANAHDSEVTHAWYIILKALDR